MTILQLRLTANCSMKLYCLLVTTLLVSKKAINKKTDRKHALPIEN